MVSIERVAKAPRLRMLDEAISHLEEDRREVARAARDELATMPGDWIEYVRFGGSKGDSVGVPPEVGSTLVQEIDRRIAIVEALHDRRRLDAYHRVRHGWLGGGFDMGGGMVTIRVFSRAVLDPLVPMPTLPNETRMTKREARERDLERLERSLASGKGAPDSRRRLQERRDRMAAEPVEDGEIVEIEGPAHELFALLEPEIRAELIGDLEERLADARARGDEKDVSNVTTALDWIRDGKRPDDA